MATRSKSKPKAKPKAKKNALPRDYIEPKTTEEAISRLSTDKLKFASARVLEKDDKSAAIAIGISPQTAYNWPAEDKEVIRYIVANYTTDATSSAVALLKQHLLDAAIIKVSALKSLDEKEKQAAATEILDRMLGRSRQAIDVKTNQPTIKAYVGWSPDEWDDE